MTDELRRDIDLSTEDTPEDEKQQRVVPAGPCSPTTLIPLIETRRVLLDDVLDPSTEVQVALVQAAGSNNAAILETVTSLGANLKPSALLLAAKRTCDHVIDLQNLFEAAQIDLSDDDVVRFAAELRSVPVNQMAGSHGLKFLRLLGRVPSEAALEAYIGDDDTSFMRSIKVMDAFDVTAAFAKPYLDAAPASSGALGQIRALQMNLRSWKDRGSDELDAMLTETIERLRPMAAESERRERDARAAESQPTA